MSSIRPLVTITILVGVGVFLFTKINEGPVALPPEMDGALEQAAAPAIPPLATANSAATPSWNDPPASTSESQPQWAQGASENVASAPASPPVNLSADHSPAPPAEMPPIPELPPAGAMTDAPPASTTTTTTTTAAETSPIPLPANIPVAQYPGDATPATPAPTPSAYGETAALPTAEAVSPAAVATTAPAAEDDRYGMNSSEPVAVAPPVTPSPAPAAAAAPTPPVTLQTSTFASEWPQIQGALQRQELVAAHEMLSRWYGNPTLTPAEAQQVELLLSQLAGTVVYSNEHRLEPPYTVHSGDTLQTIAQQYDVPWQLLAKINGIPAANMVQPGQQLKVVHGPFSAIVELDKHQFTLMLDGRYAGRFPMSTTPGVTVSEGQWVLEQKLVQPMTQDSTVVSASYTPSAVDHVLVLRNESPTASGETISITGGKSTPTGPTAVAPAAIQLSPKDAEEVADILSVGSPVMIRR
jgi:LysM repeat protein